MVLFCLNKTGLPNFFLTKKMSFSIIHIDYNILEIFFFFTIPYLKTNWEFSRYIVESVGWNDKNFFERSSKIFLLFQQILLIMLQGNSLFLSKYGILRDKVILWGTGTPLREFLWSEDMADACVFIMEHINFKDTYPADSKEVRNTHINIGTGSDLSVKALSDLIRETIGYKGVIAFDNSKPDGTMKKLTDPTKLNNLGWKHTISLEKGVKMMYEHYLK